MAASSLSANWRLPANRSTVGLLCIAHPVEAKKCFPSIFQRVGIARLQTQSPFVRRQRSVVVSQVAVV